MNIFFWIWGFLWKSSPHIKVNVINFAPSNKSIMELQ